MNPVPHTALTFERLSEIWKRKDPFVSFASYQGSVGGANVNRYPNGVRQQVQEVQYEILSRPEVVRVLQDFFGGCSRTWSPSSMARAIAQKAGELALLSVVLGRKLWQVEGSSKEAELPTTSPSPSDQQERWRQKQERILAAVKQQQEAIAAATPRKTTPPTPRTSQQRPQQSSKGE
jgi:hypothetical protein